jgi:hypothetical protein
MSLPTPNYVTIEDIKITQGIWNEKIIPSGTFVRPIYIGYVPKHVLDAPDNKWFVENKEVFAYTPMGIHILPLAKIRKLE